MSRSLRSDRPSHSVGRYVATDPQTSDPRMSQSLCSDRLSPLGRSLRSDRPNLSWTRSLRSDRTVSDINQRVRPKSVHSRLFLNASSHVPQPYHFSHHSDQSYR
ncbi:hypothetical protein DY000_02007228 [Brassica cretica]|uniref:DUF4005 domain-containing protein n=1 Tax=Brassica cretica TaxID=69181 RepID=A0ABQ7C8B0_BRACR|nr:hypothetical protein DY000_02007228 [Brassica cretica]